MKRCYLTCYDYGTGGIWLFVQARSKQEIAARYPQLTVVDRAPAWLTAAKQTWIAAHVTVDLDEPLPAWLAVLLADGPTGNRGRVPAPSGA